MPIVVTLDQRGSRRLGTVPAGALLDLLNDDRGIDRAVPFAPSSGDEIQGVFAGAAGLLRVLQLSAREGGWAVGIGLGAVTIAAGDVRQSTGDAFVRAREAVGRAKKLPWGVAVEGAGDEAERLDRAVALWYSVLARRTDHGWRVVQLSDAGMSQTAIAKELGVTQQAVTKALRTADHRLDLQGRELVAALADEAERASR